MAELENQMRSISTCEATRSYEKNSLVDEIKQIRANANDFPGAVERLLECVVRLFQPVVAKVDFRKGVTTESITRVDAKLNNEETENHIRQWIDPQLIDCQCDSNPSPRIIEFSADDGVQSVVTVPLFQGDLSHAEGAISILLKVDSAPAETVAAEIESLCIGAATLSEQQNSTASQDGLQIIGKVAGLESTKELGFLLVNQLANKYGFEQVFFGTVDKRRINVEAVSGVANFKGNSPGVTSISQAMEECMDHGSAIVFQTRGELELESGFHIHKQWSQAGNESAVCTLPLLDADRIVACISCQRPVARPITAAELSEIQSKLNPFGPAVRLIQKANAPAGQLIRQSLSKSTKRAVCPQSWWGKAILFVLVAACCYFLFATTMYRPSCVATLSPQHVTNFSAPFDTVLKKVHVAAGDEVKKGQVLFEMDSTILEAERDAIRSQLEATGIELKQALSQEDVSTAALQKKLQLALTAQLKTIEEKLKRAVVVAPTDGIITKCELKTKIGQSFRIGDPLLVFAQKDDWRVEIQVPDHLASHIAQQQTGTFASLTRPGEKFHFQVDEFDRSAQLKNGSNIFVARGNLDSTADWMRSGMEGFARIETVRKPIWWVTFHRLIDSARINFWF